MIAYTAAVFKLTNDTLNEQTLKTRLDDLSKADSGWIKKDLTIESSKIARIVLAVFGWIPAVGRLVYHFYEIDARVSKENLEIIANSFNEEYHPVSLLESYEKAAKRFNSLMPNYKVGLEPKNIALDERPGSNRKLKLLERSIKWLNNTKNLPSIKDACPSVAKKVDTVVQESLKQLNSWKKRIEKGENVPLPDYYHANRFSKNFSNICTQGRLNIGTSLYGKGVFFSSRHEFTENAYGHYAVAIDEESLSKKKAQYFPLPEAIHFPVHKNSERPMWLRVSEDVDLDINNVAYLIVKLDNPDITSSDSINISNLKLKGMQVQIIHQDIADVIRLAFDYNKKKAVCPAKWDGLYSFEAPAVLKNRVSVFHDDEAPFPRRMRHFPR